ncbi:hypothetical protein F4805DRAFT_451564 [Annulohypoxylon moriforme]|nr:hypothetical protein F4805DRAFT_451564 [Annulohypoxylon moriforme]
MWCRWRPAPLGVAWMVDASIRLLRSHLVARAIGVLIRFIASSPRNPSWFLLEREVIRFHSIARHVATTASLPR